MAFNHLLINAQLVIISVVNLIKHKVCAGKSSAFFSNFKIARSQHMSDMDLQ
ncbi:hypothetical protein ACJW31_01G038800 [Castanea mollissima]